MQQMQKFAKKLSKQIQLSARQIFISERKNAVRAVSNLDGVLLVHGAVAVRSVVVVKRPGHEPVSMKMLELTCCAVIHQVLDLVVLQVVLERWKQEIAIPNHVQVDDYPLFRFFHI